MNMMGWSHLPKINNNHLIQVVLYDKDRSVQGSLLSVPSHLVYDFIAGKLCCQPVLPEHFHSQLNLSPFWSPYLQLFSQCINQFKTPLKGKGEDDYPGTMILLPESILVLLTLQGEMLHSTGKGHINKFILHCIQNSFQVILE